MVDDLRIIGFFAIKNCLVIMFKVTYNWYNHNMCSSRLFSHQNLIYKKNYLVAPWVKTYWVKTYIWVIQLIMNLRSLKLCFLKTTCYIKMAIFKQNSLKTFHNLSSINMLMGQIYQCEHNINLSSQRNPCFIRWPVIFVRSEVYNIIPAYNRLNFWKVVKIGKYWTYIFSDALHRIAKEMVVI